jgi:GT2 family glycosyltransferase
VRARRNPPEEAVRIASVTPTYHDDHQLDQWVSLAREYRPALFAHIIVDDASAQEYRDELRRRFPDSILVERRKNGGLTSAYNDGIRMALAQGAEAVLLIVPDMRLPLGSLRLMIAALERNPDVGIVGPILFKRDGRLQEFGGSINPATFEVSKPYWDKPWDDAIPAELAVDFICGGINLTRREVFEQIGLQDERLMMYADESDFDYRAKHAGWKLLVLREAVAHHLHSGESSDDKSRPVYLMTRNRLYLVRKHTGTRAMLAAARSMILDIPITVARKSLRDRRPEIAWAYIRGIASGIFSR